MCNNLPLFNLIQKMTWWMLEKDLYTQDSYKMQRSTYWMALFFFLILLITFIYIIKYIYGFIADLVKYQYYKADVEGARFVSMTGILVDKRAYLSDGTFYFCIDHVFVSSGIRHKTYEVDICEYYLYALGERIDLLWFYGGLTNKYLGFEIVVDFEIPGDAED